MNLLDLPDEILLLILKKLNVVETLDQQCGVHSQLDRILLDDNYVSELDWTRKCWDESISPMDDLVIDRVCENILPRINEKIIELILEPNSIERVLHAVHYPKLSSLSLKNFSKKTLVEHLTKNSSQIELLSEQITYLDIRTIDDQEDNDNNAMDLLEMLVPLSKCLIDLTFHQTISSEGQNTLISRYSSTIFSSLTKLNIKLNIFEEYLFLFDGRFPSLSHSIIYVDKIFSTPSSSSVDNRINLSKLKYFSLTSYVRTNDYDELILPFIRQMSNLEELHLFLNIFRGLRSSAVDGNDLQKNLLIDLCQLKRFHFSIYTYIYQFNNEMSRLSNDDVQQNFVDNQFGQVRSYVHQNSSKYIYGCHVYSIPFQFKEFLRLGYSFPNDVFIAVRTLFIHDYISWDNHFFKRINQSFPLMETLIIANSSPQINQFQLNNYLKQLPITIFNRLSNLHLSHLHIDYIEQFLFNRYTHLPCLCQLEIDYEELNTLTNSFTNDPTQFNFSHIRRLMTNEAFARSQNFSKFFPSLE